MPAFRDSGYRLPFYTGRKSHTKRGNLFRAYPCTHKMRNAPYFTRPCPSSPHAREADATVYYCNINRINRGRRDGDLSRGHSSREVFRHVQPHTRYNHILYNTTLRVCTEGPAWSPAVVQGWRDIAVTTRPRVRYNNIIVRYARVIHIFIPRSRARV